MVSLRDQFRFPLRFTNEGYKDKMTVFVRLNSVVVSGFGCRNHKIGKNLKVHSKYEKSHNLKIKVLRAFSFCIVNNIFIMENDFEENSFFRPLLSPSISVIIIKAISHPSRMFEQTLVHVRSNMQSYWELQVESRLKMVYVSQACSRNIFILWKWYLHTVYMYVKRQCCHLHGKK